MIKEMIEETARSLPAQTTTLALLSTEAAAAAFELRYMLAAMIVLTLADFWWALRELRHRRELALAAGDLPAAERLRPRFSRAGRRTLNKIVDYITYLLVGAFLGYAVTEPLDIATHTTTAALGLGLGCLFDVSSILGHVLAIRGIHFDPYRALLSALRLRSHDAARIVEDATDIDERASNP